MPALKTPGGPDAYEYTVAVISPLAVELSALRLMLDFEYETPDINTSDDDNTYTCGSMCGHKVVLVNLPQWHNGPISASNCVIPLHRTFINVQVTLLVGIGGGLPSREDASDSSKNIQLGDVVIGWDGDKNFAVWHWDPYRVARILPQPDRRILNVLTKMESNQHLGRSRFYEHLTRCTNISQFKFPGRRHDRLYNTSYEHIPHQEGDCQGCDPRQLMTRAARGSDNFQIHHGTIACVESVVTDAEHRARIRDETNALCVEMEAAGVLGRKDCLVIRGISDYADSHKNDHWKLYAAATAASVAREFLSIMKLSDMSRQSHTELKVQTTAPPNKQYLIPRDPTSQFTGREHLLQWLRESYFSQRTVREHVQKRCVMYGLGGSGKTELCLKFAAENREEFWGIFWVDASSRQSIERGFAAIAKDCKVEADVDALKTWLSNQPSLWLLIFDNADDVQLDLSPYFPPGERGVILITTRNPSARRYATVGHYELGRMDSDDAIDLLLRTIDASDDGLEDPSRRAEALAVVRALGHLAIAIEKAGAVIRESHCGMKDYLTRHHQRGQGTFNEKSNENSEDPQSEVHKSWEVSLQAMKEIFGEAGQDAIDLLHVFSFFHYNGISEEMLDRSCHKLTFSQGSRAAFVSGLQQMLSTQWRKLSRSRDNVLLSCHEDWHPDRYKDAIAKLSSFSLISRDKWNLISLHPLVQAWARDRLDPAMGERSWTTAIQILGASITWSFKTEDYQYRRSIIPHVQNCLRSLYSEKIFKVNRSDRNWLCIIEKLALTYSENCRRREAIELMEGVLDCRRRTLGSMHPETLHAMLSLAIYFSGVGRVEEALQMAETVVTARVETLGVHHVDTLSAKYCLAVRYGDTGQTEREMRLIKDVLRAQKDVLDEADPDVLRSMNSLAICHSKRGQHDKAILLAAGVLRIRKQTLGKYHPETLITMHNLAIWKGEINQQQDALDIMAKVVLRRKFTLSKEHPDTLTSMHSLAMYYCDAGLRKRALQIMTSVAETRMKVLGPKHPDTLMSRNRLAVLR